MKEWWWKIGSLLLLVYVFSVGLVVEVPALVILNESIRNLFFHVPLWFAMTVLLINAMVYSIKYLLSQNINYDYKSKSLIEVATAAVVLPSSATAVVESEVYKPAYTLCGL